MNSELLLLFCCSVCSGYNLLSLRKLKIVFFKIAMITALVSGYITPKKHPVSMKLIIFLRMGKVSDRQY